MSNPITDREQRIVDALTQAYSEACFPMADPRTREVGWYCPDPRAIIPLETFHVPDNLRRRVASGRFEITTDSAFEEVMRACAQPRAGRRDTWIDDNLLEWYSLLNRAGHAHSIEAWLDRDGRRELVGGLYGVHMGGLFAGESMFSRPELGGTDASKVCLVHLVRHMQRRGMTLLDVQFTNLHLEQFGVREIRHASYQKLLDAAIAVDAPWIPFDPERTRAESGAVSGT